MAKNFRMRLRSKRRIPLKLIHISQDIEIILGFKLINYFLILFTK